MANRIQLRRDTAANWTRVNPVLEDGEPGLEIDTNRVKYGDGNTAWTNLSYSGGGSASFDYSTVQEGSSGPSNITSITGGDDTGVSLTSENWAQLMWVPNTANVTIEDIGDGPATYTWAYVDDEGFHVEASVDEVKRDWRFTTDGNLELPLGGKIGEVPSPTFVGNAVVITPADGTDDNQQLMIYPTQNEGNHLHMTSGNLAVTDIFLGDDYQYIRTRTDQGMTIGTGGGEMWSGNAWTFGANGILSTPGNVQVGTTGTYGNISFVDTISANNYAYANGVSILSGLGGGGASTGDITFDGIKIIGANIGNGSGDIKLVPDNTGTYYDDGQYVRIYPTRDVPDSPHIHIDSGYGGDLILGDDERGIDINHDANVYIRTDQYGGAYNWQFGADGKLTAPGEVYGQFFTLRGANDPGTDIGSLGYGGNVVTISGYEGFNIETGEPESGPLWQFDTDGNLTLPLGGMISETANTIQIQKNSGNVVVVAGIAGIPAAVNNVSTPSGGWNGAGPSENLATEGGTGTGLRVTVSGFEGGYASTVTIVTPGSGYTVGDSITVVGGESAATFTISGVNDSLNNWRFDTDGNLTLPSGNAAIGAIETTDSIDLYGNSDTQYVQINYNNTNFVYVDSTGAHMQAGPSAPGEYEIFLSTDGSTTFPDNKPVSITGNLTVGNLVVNGNSNIINTESYVVSDNIIQMANANPADTLDLGFIAHRTVSGNLQHTGLIRDASAGLWKLFSNVEAQPGNTVDFTDAVYDDLIAGNVTVTSLSMPSGYLNFSSSPAATLNGITFSDGTAQTTAYTGGGSITVDNFTGNGSQTSYTLSVVPLGIEYTMVSLAGTLQPRTVYSLTTDVLTFSSAPPSGAVIEVTILSSGVVNTETITITNTNITTTSVNVGNLTATSITANNIVTDTLVADIVAEGINLTVDTLTANSVINGGSGTPTLQSDTSIELSAATVVRIPTSPLQFYNCTSTVRDTIAASNGYVIYNTTSHKLQVYANGSWVDLH